MIRLLIALAILGMSVWWYLTQGGKQPVTDQQQVLKQVESMDQQINQQMDARIGELNKNLENMER